MEGEGSTLGWVAEKCLCEEVASAWTGDRGSASVHSAGGEHSREGMAVKVGQGSGKEPRQDSGEE